MNTENFTLTPDDTASPARTLPAAPNSAPSANADPRGATCAAACPLARIPAPVWNALLRRPFRKRHPFIFWLSLLALVLIGLAVFSRDENGQGLLSGGDRLALVTVRGPIMDVAPCFSACLFMWCD